MNCDIEATHSFHICNKLINYITTKHPKHRKAITTLVTNKMKCEQNFALGMLNLNEISFQYHNKLTCTKWISLQMSVDVMDLRASRISATTVNGAATPVTIKSAKQRATNKGLRRRADDCVNRVTISDALPKMPPSTTTQYSIINSTSQ